MDDALRVNHHLDVGRRCAKQPVRLDHLEALVHQRCRVDRDLAAHAPIRVLAGLFWADAGEVEVGQVAKRPTAARQPDLAHAAHQSPLRQHLKHGVVLAVDRQQGGAVVAHRRHEQGPGHHQSLFVGQQDALASTRRCQIGGKAGGPDDAGHHRIHVRRGGGFGQGRCAGDHPGITATAPQASVKLGGRIGVGENRQPRRKLAAQAQHRLDVAVGYQGIGDKALRMSADDVERLQADRAGRTEDAESSWRAHPTKPASHRPAAHTGIAAARPSTRSSSPPWPGNSVPLSLTPATRFIHDS